MLLTDIAAETCVRVPDACGLARATRDLFRAHRRQRIEYPGEALSDRVREDCAALGIGAALLRVSADQLIEFSRHLETIVPSLVAGLEPGTS